MTYRKPIITAKDLANCLLELGDRPLYQIITVYADIGQNSQKEIRFDQLQNFFWNVDNDELEITL